MFQFARVLVGVGMVSLATGTLYADEEKLPLDKLPGAVANAVKKRFPEAKLMGAEKEVEDGLTLYEVGLMHSGSKFDVTLTEDGKLFEIEKRIAPKDLPAVVGKALDVKYPKATVMKAEEITKVTDGKEALAYYEVLLMTAEKKPLEVAIKADGKIDKEEDKSNEKDED